MLTYKINVATEMTKIFSVEGTKKNFFFHGFLYINKAKRMLDNFFFIKLIKRELFFALCLVGKINLILKRYLNVESAFIYRRFICNVKLSNNFYKVRCYNFRKEDLRYLVAGNNGDELKSNVNIYRISDRT